MQIRLVSSLLLLTFGSSLTGSVGPIFSGSSSSVQLNYWQMSFIVISFPSPPNTSLPYSSIIPSSQMVTLLRTLFSKSIISWKDSLSAQIRRLNNKKAYFVSILACVYSSGDSATTPIDIILAVPESSNKSSLAYLLIRD